jgi:hypothetical protein
MHGRNGVKNAERKGVDGTQQSQKWLEMVTLNSKRHHLTTRNCAKNTYSGRKILVGEKLQPPLLREERGR